MQEEKIAHLGFIQAVIARMAGNSLAIKGGSMALVAAVIALVGASGSFVSIFILAAIFPIIICWWLDAKYLQLERQFRNLYDHTRLHPEKVENFTLNPMPYLQDVDGIKSVDHIFKIAFSWSVFGFYLAIVGILLFAFFVTTNC